MERHESTRPNESHAYKVKMIACRYEKTPYQGLVDLELSPGPHSTPYKWIDLDRELNKVHRVGISPKIEDLNTTMN
jgi:hypothetical protein